MFVLFLLPDRPRDAKWLTPEERASTRSGRGHALAKGVPPVELIAELFGRSTGCSRGRGGSMHLFAPEVGLMGTSGLVGACVLQAAGAGYIFRLMKTDRVAVAFFGDGAVNNAAFHEGLNLTAIWKLPVLFVCENNQFATEVQFAYAAGNPSVAGRGVSYGMPGVEVDGNDVRAVHAACGAAIARARAGDGPTLIECKTCRTRPHAEGMGDFTYRTRAEVDEWKTRCPIQRVRGEVPDANAIEAEVAAEIDTAMAAAEVARGPTRRRITCTPNRAPFLPHLPPVSGSLPIRKPRSKRWTRRWRRTPAPSCWARGSASAAGTSRPPPGCSPSTARSGCGTRPSASAGSSASGVGRP